MRIQIKLLCQLSLFKLNWFVSHSYFEWKIIHITSDGKIFRSIVPICTLYQHSMMNAKISALILLEKKLWLKCIDEALYKNS